MGNVMMKRIHYDLAKQYKNTPKQPRSQGAPWGALPQLIYLLNSWF